jgi:hypothetical protein
MESRKRQSNSEGSYNNNQFRPMLGLVNVNFTVDGSEVTQESSVRRISRVLRVIVTISAIIDMAAILIFASYGGYKLLRKARKKMIKK